MEIQSIRSARSGSAAVENLPRKPIDHQHLDRFTFGSASLELEVLGLFAGQAPETLAFLKAAHDAKSWRDAAHTLKGSARAVGAWRVAEWAAAAEALREGHAHPQREAAIEAVAEALEEVCLYIARL